MTWHVQIMMIRDLRTSNLCLCKTTCGIQTKSMHWHNCTQQSSPLPARIAYSNTTTPPDDPHHLPLAMPSFNTVILCLPKAGEEHAAVGRYIDCSSRVFTTSLSLQQQNYASAFFTHAFMGLIWMTWKYPYARKETWSWVFTRRNSPLDVIALLHCVHSTNQCTRWLLR